VTGVAIGIANIILLMSMTDMGRRQTLGLLEEFGARVLIFTPYFDVSSGGMALFSQANTTGHLPMTVYEALRRSKYISRKDDGVEPEVSALLLLSGHVEGPRHSWFTTVAGATAEVFQFAGFELEQGRWITAGDELRLAQVAVLGRNARLELFGDAAALGETITIRGEEFEVIGTLEHKPAVGMEENDNRVFIPQGLDEDEALRLVKAELQAAMPDDQPFDEVAAVFTVYEATKLMDSTLSIFRTVLLGVASIALIVAGIGIMNVMLIRVLRRRVEIGLLLGLIVSTAGLAIFAAYSQWEFYVSPLTLLIAIGFGALVGVLFGAYPAWTAGRVDPIKSLRSEQ
jgi:putative ABC transport system permease protein